MAKWESAPIEDGFGPRSQPQPKSQPQRVEVMGTKSDDEAAKYLKFGSRTGSREAFNQLPAATREPLLSAARDYFNKTGKPLQINSAMRSEADQKRLYDETVAAGRPGIGPTGMPVAKPGKSAHGRGIAIDIQQGKDDPVAVGILNQYGFVQTVKNDPVHFEVRGGGEKPRGRIGPQPGGFMGKEEGPAPTLSDVGGAVAKGVTNVGTLAQPIVRGLTGGLSQYGEAAITRKPGETFSESLARGREAYEQKRQAFPGYQVGGEILGATLGAVAGAPIVGAAAKGLGAGAATTSIAKNVVPAAVLSGTTTYTASPETTLAEAAGSAATTATVAGVLSGAGMAVNQITKGLGNRFVRKNIENIIERTQSDNPAVREGAESQLQRIFGERFEMAKKYADRPHWQNVFGVSSKEEAVQRVNQLSLSDFAKLMVKDAENLTFAREAARNAAMAPRAGAMQEAETAKRLGFQATGQELRGALQGVAATVGGLAGYYGANAMDIDPALGILAGAALAPTAAMKIAGAKGLTMGYALSPQLQAQIQGAGRIAMPVAGATVSEVKQEIDRQSAPQRTQKPTKNKWESAPIVND